MTHCLRAMRHFIIYLQTPSNFKRILPKWGMINYKRTWIRYTVTMFFFTFLHHYIWWHYSSSLAGYVRVSRNFWWYFFHIFSIRQLVFTLFAPYKRMVETPSAYFSFQNLFERIILNLFSRLVGSVARISIILVGVVTLTIYTIISMAGFAIWLASPLLIFLGVITGGWLLFI